MNPLRLALNLLQLAFIAVWTALWISLSVLLGLLTFNRELPLVMARRCWAPAIWRITGSRMTVEPLPDVDWTRPHIFVMNHQSMFDIPVAFEVLPANLRFVAKRSLRGIPFLGWYMRFTKMIFVDRSNRVQAVRSLAEAGQRIREGSSILVYPEGTRSRDGRIQPFKKGPFVLAASAGVPLVPVAIDGSGALMPTGRLRILPTHLRVKVGTPIPVPPRADRDALLREVRDALIRLHLEIGGAGGGADAIAEEGREGNRRTPSASSTGR